MSINLKILLFIWSIVILVSGLFTYEIGEVQKSEYMSGVDRLLYSSALMAKSLMGENYHDKLSDENSISDDQYLEYIDRYNRLCEKIGLQYLWSNLVVNGDIVFTSSTSTSKNVDNGDHALFFDAHSNPDAFNSVLENKKTTYSTFENEWGKGRMVLIPFLDMHGRRYVFGASISIDEIDQKLADVDFRSFLIFLSMLGAGGLASIIIGNTITRPIRAISNVARDISNGDYGKQVNYISGDPEFRSLTDSINNMSTSIYKHNYELESLVRERTDELKVKETELLESHAREQHAGKMASLGEMASNIGHEINSPLQYISLVAYRTKNKIKAGDTEEISKLMDSITATTERISKVVESLRKLTRDSFNDPYENTPIKNIVEDVTGIIMERYRINGIDFEVRYLGNSENSSLTCQHIQIAQIIVNLLNNAFDAVKNRDEKWIHLEVDDSSDQVTFSVTDSGPGIPKELQVKVFEPLFTTKEIGKGTGIGLSISLEIAKKHKGSLILDKNSKTTRFVLYLPKVPVDSV